ncbi:hypothetical protein BN136_2799 [Cronobacter universalis NCTC 9529]|nr:hypothetical protein BN136_2799 [Cronobacter universalis NCTC 9529]
MYMTHIIMLPGKIWSRFSLGKMHWLLIKKLMVDLKVKLDLILLC